MKINCSYAPRIAAFLLCIVMIFPSFVLPVQATEQLQDDLAEKAVTIVSEDTLLRDMFTKHYVCSDGTNIAVVYPEAVHYFDGIKWEDVDNRLHYNTVTGKYETTGNTDFNLSFSSTGQNVLTMSQKREELYLSQRNSSKTVGTSLSYGILAYSGEKEIPMTLAAKKTVRLFLIRKKSSVPLEKILMTPTLLLSPVFLTG